LEFHIFPNEIQSTSHQPTKLINKVNYQRAAKYHKGKLSMGQTVNKANSLAQTIHLLDPGAHLLLTHILKLFR